MEVRFDSVRRSTIFVSDSLPLHLPRRVEGEAPHCLKTSDVVKSKVKQKVLGIFFQNKCLTRAGMCKAT